MVTDRDDVGLLPEPFDAAPRLSQEDSIPANFLYGKELAMRSYTTPGIVGPVTVAVALSASSKWLYAPMRAPHVMLRLHLPTCRTVAAGTTEMPSETSILCPEAFTHCSLDWQLTYL